MSIPNAALQKASRDMAKKKVFALVLTDLAPARGRSPGVTVATEDPTNPNRDQRQTARCSIESTDLQRTSFA